LRRVVDWFDDLLGGKPGNKVLPSQNLSAFFLGTWQTVGFQKDCVTNLDADLIRVHLRFLIFVAMHSDKVSPVRRKQ